MPHSISREEADALRARLVEALKDEPQRSPKRVAVRRAFGQSNFTSFMRGTRGASPDGRARVLALLERGGVAPTTVKTGRPAVQRLTPDEAKALRAEVMRAAEKHGSLGAFFLKVMGIASRSQSHLYGVIKHHRPLTAETAARLRAALDGRTIPPTIRRKSAALTVAPSTWARAQRAGRNVLAGLRIDAGNVLSARFGGNVAGLARELGLTAHRLSKFLDGGPLGLDESADVANRLGPLVRTETANPAPGLMMVRAMAGGVSAEAWTNGNGNGHAHATAEPLADVAKKMVERWGREAIAIVVQLAQGGGAL